MAINTEPGKKIVEPSGRFYLRLKFGDEDIFVNPSTLKELTIVQDLEHFLPMFTLSIADTTGDLIHIFPFDRGMSKVYIELADDIQSENRNSWDFMVYRRKPVADQSQAMGIYTINGLLDVEGIYSPDYCRGFNQNIKTTLENISKDELKIEDTEIGLSLDYVKNLIQPRWSNIQFLNYLADNLEGKGGESAYKTFLKCRNHKQYFLFKSLDELISSPIQYKFILKDTPYEDRYPVYMYSIIDNYKIHNVFSARNQNYSYFDYDTSTFKTASIDATGFLSTTDFFLIDQNDLDDSSYIWETGRSNDFTSNFKGQVKGSFYNRLDNLVKLWITTKGIPNICPGDTVEMFFPQGVIGDKVYSYQYSGFWLVERVIQMVGSTYLTRLLLTRTGLDTDKKNTLVKALKKKAN